MTEKLADCNYSNLTESPMKDMKFTGIFDDTLREKLFINTRCKNLLLWKRASQFATKGNYGKQDR